MSPGHHLLHKSCTIGAFYSLKPSEWLGLVLVLLSTEGVPQLLYYIKVTIKVILLYKGIERIYYENME